MHKLCEYGGNRPFPKGHIPDCYENIDEDDLACKEKYRMRKRTKIASRITSPLLLINGLEID